MTSNLSAFAFIPERAPAVPALWNDIFSILSSNIAAVGSSASLSSPSGNTVSISTNLEVIGGAHFQHLSIGSTPPSYLTTAAVTIEVNSAFSDYLYLVDSSAQKSSYVIGSRAGGTADGLNIWDASAGTMIASFSKQSIRFFQNVVGPVFDVGGALASTYNAGTFGTGGQSKESRIQAAIDQASIDSVARVYVPANMYPYSASSVSFVYTVQMVREGGNWTVYDIEAYGAKGDGVANNSAAIQQAFNSAAVNKNIAFIPQGRFRVLSKLTLGSNLEVTGAGESSILFFNWFFSSGATSGGDVYIDNAGRAIGSDNTAIRLHDFTIEGDNATGLSVGTTVPVGAGGILLRKGADIDISRMRIINVPVISLAHQGISNARFIDNYISGSGHDGITGGSYDTWPCERVVVANNVIGPVGDDAIAINKAVDTTKVGTTLPTQISIVGNTIFGAVSNSTKGAGRGVLILGSQNIAVVGNSIASTFAKGIYIDRDVFSGNANSQFVTVIGNVISGAGQVGDGSQTPNGIELDNTDYTTVTGNVVSNSSGAGVFVTACRYINLVGNSIISNGKQITSFGVDCSSSTNSFVVIADNIVKNNGGAGIFLNLAQFIQVRNNIVVDNGSVGTGALNQGSGILIQSGGGAGQSPQLAITGNYITDTRTAASKTQSYGIFGNTLSGATLFIAHNYVSGNSGVGIFVSGNPGLLQQFANSDFETSASSYVGFWSPSAFTAGLAGLPSMAFLSEQSLGWYRSAASTMALSYGSMVVPSKLSMGGPLTVTGTAALEVLIAPGSSYGWTGKSHFIASASGAGSYSPDAATDDLVIRPNGLNNIILARGDNSNFDAAAIIYSTGTIRFNLGPSLFTTGVSVNPTIAYSSESSLGWYRSASSTMALSYGTIDLTGSGAMTSIASLKIKSGTNNSCGTAILGSNGSVNVANTYIKTGDLIFLTDQTPSGTLGDLEVGGIRNSSGFTIQSTSITDTSTVGWLIIRPG